MYLFIISSTQIHLFQKGQEEDAVNAHLQTMENNAKAQGIDVAAKVQESPDTCTNPTNIFAPIASGLRVDCELLRQKYVEGFNSRFGYVKKQTL